MIMKIKIKILYEDSNILAIDKPAGILVHPDQKSKEKTILDIFKKKYPQVEIVHRLDKETSGVMLLAKDQKAHEFLKKQFANREVKKTYYAIVSGWVKNDHGIINKPIGRSPKDFRRHLAGRGARGEMREAITQYKVLKRFTSPLAPLLIKERGKFTYLEIKPKTGRTHQIRVHLKFLNHPVACDSLYNPNGSCPKGLKRLALHAQSIEFSAPGGSAFGGKNSTSRTLKIESPLPLQFKRVLK
jgi:23S rRNA pseudouridine1911/1915/1917 synthase